MLNIKELSNASFSLPYRADIDGLRAIAVLLVVGFHAFPNFIPGGYIGVDIFFVISGYLITSILWFEFLSNKFTIITFYSRRIVRIFPALLMVLIFCLVLGWYALLPNEYELLGKNILAGASFVSNFILLKEVGYFDINSELKPLLHLWSLGIEEQFYAFWPIALIIFWGRKWSWLVAILSLGLISFICNLYFSSINIAFDFYSPFTRFWELLVGAFIGIWVLTNKVIFNWLPILKNNENNTQFHLINSADFMSLLGIILITFGVFYFNGGYKYPSWWALIPVFGAVCVLISPQSTFSLRLLSHKSLVYIGKISYPLYLWHWPLLSFFHIIKGGQLETSLKFEILFSSFLLAFLTFRYIETPIKKSKKLNKNAFLLLVSMAFIGCIGFYIFVENGLSKRESIQDIINTEKVLLNPQHFIKSDGSCDNLLAKSTPYPNVCITNSNEPRAMIVGDSHAIALYGGIRNREIDEPVVLLAGNGCLPLENYVVQDNNEARTWCINYSSNILDAIDKIPTIEKIYINTRGPVYFSGEGYGIEGKNKLSIARLGGKDNLSQEERFHLGLSNFIKSLIAKNIKVIIITEVPELGEDPKNCIARRRVLFSKEGLSSCSQPKYNVLARKAKYLEIIKSVQKENPNLTVYHGMNSFCDDSMCYGKGPEGLWYWDDDHLSLLGSIKLLKDVLYINSQ